MMHRNHRLRKTSIVMVVMAGFAALVWIALTAIKWLLVPELDIPLLDAAKHGDQRAVERLLQSGANPNANDGNGNSALSLARKSRNQAVVKLLVDAGARD